MDKEKITPETSFVNDLGADSLDTVELVMELEEEFDIQIPDEDAEKIEHVLGVDVVRQLEKRLNYATHDPHGKAIPGQLDIQRGSSAAATPPRCCRMGPR